VTVRCGRARRILWPDGGPRPVTSEIVEAQEHLAECEACRKFVNDMRHMSHAIRTVAPRPHAPAELRERLLATLAQSRKDALWPRTLLRRGAWRLAAATVALVAALLWLSSPLWRYAAHENAITALAEDHMRSLKVEGITSSDSATVAAWLTRRLSFAMHLPLFPKAELRGARLCLMDGRTGAAVEYSVDGEMVSYYVMPEAAEGAAQGAAKGAERTPTFRYGSHAGYQVVVWREPGLMHALVGSLPKARLAALARYCVERALSLWSRDPTPAGPGRKLSRTVS
jgi:anti-sigma factor RsiW